MSNMIRLDLLPIDHPLRSAPLHSIGAAYRYIDSKSPKPRPVLATFGIANSTFNRLGSVWTRRYEWYCLANPVDGRAN